MFPRAKAVVARNGQMPNDLQPAIRSPVVIAAALALERQPKRTDVQLATGGRSRRDHRDGRQELDVHVASSFEGMQWTMQIWRLPAQPMRSASPIRMPSGPRT